MPAADAGAGAFTGFGPKALPFLRALDFHQSREWFNENRALYESDCLQPLRAFTVALSARMEAEGLPLRGDPKASLFRIHRDVRFSREKHPYKTHVSAVFTRTGTKKDVGGLYVQFGPADENGTGGSFIAAGAWFPEADVLRAWREDMVERPERVFALEDALVAQGHTIGSEDTGGTLTRLPRGFTHVEDERLQGWLKRKSFVIEQAVPDERLGATDLLDDAVALAHHALPLLQHYWRIADPIRAAREAT